MKKSLIAMAILSLAAQPVLAEEDNIKDIDKQELKEVEQAKPTRELNSGFQGTWFSSVNTPHGFATPLPKAYGNWEMKGLIKPMYLNQGVDGSEKGASAKLRVDINGNIEITENFRFITEAWIMGLYNAGDWESNQTQNPLGSGGDNSISFEQLQVGFEHKTLGAITLGQQVSQWGSTVFDQYNMLGLTDNHLNPKNYGTKLFYHNKWNNKWLVRAFVHDKTPIFDESFTKIGQEATYGLTLAYDTFSPYIKGFDGWGIYYDVNNEDFSTQYGHAPLDMFGTGGAAAGGYQRHNIDHEELTHAVNAYYRTGGWYFAGHASYSAMNGDKDLDDTLASTGDMTRLGLAYKGGIGLSTVGMIRYTFDNGFEPLISFGNDITGSFALVDLAYNYSKQLRLFTVTRVASDDNTQFAVGAKLFF